MPAPLNKPLPQRATPPPPPLSLFAGLISKSSHSGLLDLKKLNKLLPLPKPPPGLSPPVLVVGGSVDAIVDSQGAHGLF